MAAAFAKLGFTLIELLVVTLIIGILVAVALPQYQKAVEKFHATEALVLLKAVVQAQQAYRFTEDEFADSLDKLDITVPWTGTEKPDDPQLTGPWVDETADIRSNKYWSLAMNKKGIQILRLTGDYRNAGWRVLDFKDPKIACVERYYISDGYCTKIFKKTTPDHSGTWYKYYTD